MAIYGEVSGPRVTDVEQEFSDFSYVVVHDLSAPLRHIKEFLGRLTDGLDGESPGPLEAPLTDRQQKLLHRIDRAVDKSEVLLAQLGTYANLQQRPLDLADYAGGDLFRDAWRALAPKVLDSGAEFSVGALGRIHVDRMLFVEALKRILDNAIRYRRPGTTPRIQVSRVPDPSDWVVRVTDNGIGLAADQREKVFRMFYRLARDPKDPLHGTGLTVGRRILRRHGGELRFVDSDDGTCVELRLPSAQ